MVRLQEILQYFVTQKISSDPLWKNVKVILSGHDVSASNKNIDLLINFYIDIICYSLEFFLLRNMLPVMDTHTNAQVMFVVILLCKQ